MSPVPPPAGTYIPSDDWTEDPSFEISPSAQHFALPSSPSSASSSSTTSTHHSRSPKQVARYHTNSPLRNSFTSSGTGKGVNKDLNDGKGTLKLKKREVEQLELDFDLDEDFDLPTLSAHNASQRPRSSTASSSSSLITRTVVGTGPTGVGTVTRLGSSSSSGPNLFLGNKGTVKARALAIEKSWEADVDFDAINDLEDDIKQSLLPAASSSKIHLTRRFTLSPPQRRVFMPPPDALDGLGFELDGDDADQATLKAGATIKAMLPPPRPRQDSTIKQPSLPPPSSSVLSPSTPPAQDPDSIELEADFALPLNLTNLTLITQPPPARRGSRPRSSNASTANTESWDSPGTSVSGKKGTGATGWGWGSDNSPMGGKRRSETSATSISDALPETPVEKTSRNKGALELDLDEEEDMELGLVLPSPTFFSNNRATELNSILDRKRRPQFAPSPSHHRAGTDDSRKIGDDSFEDGLVLDEPGVELSRHRLREKKRARDKPMTAAGSSTRRGSSLGGAAKSVAKEREKAWEKQREQGWGRNTPLSGVRERTQSSLGQSLRSNSASAMPTFRETSTKRSDSPALTGREKESMRSRSGQIHTIMPPPPVPPPVPVQPTLPPTPSSSSRLRHQKSHYHIAPPQSPSLTRKQSLASLQDALGDRTLTPLDTPHHHHNQASSSNGRYHNSTSRLTMPTSSSKAKIRPAISSIFPSSLHLAHLPKNEFPTPSSSASSISSLATPQSYATIRRGNEFSYSEKDKVKRTIDIPRRAKNWGDGTELDSIDDLRVEEEVDNNRSMAGLGLGKPSRRGHETQSRTAVSAKAIESAERRKKSGSGTTTTAKRTRTRKPAGLIKHLGGADKKKVVGEMTWNPATLRWEGNESVLRDFDAVSTTSARPALITHYTGSSVGVGGVSSPVGAVGSTPAAPRIVGDMQFDPIHMRWVSILSPEDDEPDPFEGMADDEDDGSGLDSGRGGTITRAAGRKLVTIGSSGHAAGAFGFGGSTSVTASTAWSSRLASESSIATLGSVGSNSWDDRAVHEHHHQQPHHLRLQRSGADLRSQAVDDELWKECKAAEERHRKEMKGWIMRQPVGREEIRERERKEEKRLWEIRHLAMKS
ncbi:hypothetical protein I317_01787 [Kwoniella heveanensis CBS 569]|nr:hypothetical protein I317_01787 [Kwoniella heveanensis CBS 569]